MRSRIARSGVFLLALVMSISLFGCSSKDKEKLKKVRLNEVARSVFYAPMYAAISEGYFEEEGIDLEISTGQGADKTMQQVLSGSVDIGFSGPEQVIYIYNQGREDYPKVFAQLTQKDGSFLISRENEKDFKYESLKGKTIVGGRPGGMPEMSLEYVLKKHGLTPGKDVNIVTNIAFNATAGAFTGGTGDYVALFEPTGSMLEKEKKGYIVSSIGKEAGDISYTTFYANQSYIKKNPEIIESFTRAIYKGQQFVEASSDEEVAKAIIDFFPGSDLDVLTNVVKNYRNVEAFSKTPSVSEENVDHLMDIIQDYDSTLIPTRPNFKDIVDTSFTDKVVQK
ncbi:ABC transporter periplasmic-binding protein [Clostridium bornimense]|uniref:ABC transporter periplasmic-binding protein n=1 Tax=Clostridium bornimense TaxID=1216932 RepID=W6SJA0_9CLOT|nr:ABC transporter substrate-binding protein [Clostridium bornimense]CDM69755.1 ABC transporter periplasmic-binding protein [Clostridium bornimense]